MNENLLRYAKVNSRGSILLGENTVADGYEHGRDIGIFTHIHTDHIHLFNMALHECSSIYLSPPTYDLLEALERGEDETVSTHSYFEGRHIHRLDFNTPLRPRKHSRKPDPHILYSDEITLLQTKHILGSAQVRISTMDGKRIVYSGDFVYPGTEPIECDVLVLDSTHGAPHFNTQVDTPSIENRIVEMIDDEIQAGLSITVRAHTGRLQYIMSILSSKFKDIPFLVGDRNRRLIPVYGKYGMPIKDTIPSDSLDGDEIVSATSRPFIEFKTVQEAHSLAELDKRTAIFKLGGNYIGHKMTIKKTAANPGEYCMGFEDHGNYEGILEYVNRCNPKLVITDLYRSKQCEALAKSIRENLDIPAVPQPQSLITE